MGHQLANMAMLYVLIGLLNKRARKAGNNAARQVGQQKVWQPALSAQEHRCSCCSSSNRQHQVGHSVQCMASRCRVQTFEVLQVSSASMLGGRRGLRILRCLAQQQWRDKHERRHCPGHEAKSACIQHHVVTLLLQEEVLLSICMGLAICNLLASLRADNAQDYVYMGYFLICKCEHV